jgi:hypothetical protein
VADEVVRGVYDVLLERMRELAHRVEAAGRNGAAPDLDVLRDLSEEMARVRSYVPDADAYWLDPTAPLPPRMRKLLESLPDSVPCWAASSGRTSRGASPVPARTS